MPIASFGTGPRANGGRAPRFLDHQTRKHIPRSVNRDLPFPLAKARID